MTYGVTGSTGALGALVIQSLLDLKIPASSIVALARDGKKADKLKAKGIDVRLADYNDKDSLIKALNKVDRLLLVSSNEVGKRAAQHLAVIQAAKEAGVKLLAYTSLTQADTSTNPLAPEHKATEAALRTSGVPFVVLRNNWYIENYSDDVRYAKDSGVIVAAAGSGRVAAAARSDYAEAAAKVLTGEHHEGKTYELTGASAFDYTEFAKAASEVLGKPVSYKSLSPAERKKSLLAAGLPEGVADFVTSLDQAIEAGTLNVVSTELQTLLGRKPKSLKDTLKAALA